MGQDTSTSSVCLTVLTSQREKTETLFSDTSNEDAENGTGVWIYWFHEIDYGNLDFLTKLRDAGIAFDSSWDSGSEYEAGTSSCRFTFYGSCIEKNIYDSHVNPPIDMLMGFIDQPVNLRKYILDHQETISVLPLDQNQETYGKLYQAHKLIGSTPVSKEE